MAGFSFSLEATDILLLSIKVSFSQILSHTVDYKLIVDSLVSDLAGAIGAHCI